MEISMFAMQHPWLFGLMVYLAIGLVVAGFVFYWDSLQWLNDFCFVVACVLLWPAVPAFYLKRWAERRKTKCLIKK